MARSFTSCGWPSGASAPLAFAWASIWPYCCVAEVSSCSAGTSLRRPDAPPTSTCAAAGSAAAPAAASTKARRAFQMPPAQQRQPYGSEGDSVVMREV